MDLKSAQAELSALQAKIASQYDHVKSGKATDAELDAIERDGDRIIQLKGMVIGLKNAEKMAPFEEVTVEETFPQGLGGPSLSVRSSGEKGYLTASGLKAGVQKTAAPGIKAIVAAGSSVTETVLSKTPIQLGAADSLGLLSMIEVKRRGTPKYSYVAQSVRTNNAAVVAPGATKPESVFTVKSVDNALAVYAHTSEYVDKYLLQDNDDLKRFLEAELRDGVLRKVTSDAIAAYSGASGVQTVTTSAAYTPAKGADAVYDAASKIGSLGYAPNLVILPTSVYDGIRLNKATTGEYIGGNPFEGGTRAGLWGMPVLLSPDLAAGTGLVLDTSAVGISTDEEGIETLWDVATGFAKNQLRARTEGRFAFDVFVPAALAKITFTA